jgi:PIN domain nuclease of toxin-antitoxin system
MIVLDTHAWIWWTSDPTRLGRRAQRTLKTARRIGVPAICCLEVARLAVRGRITLDRPVLDWMLDALAVPRVELIPLTPAIATRAADLPAEFPGDAADRLIVATALVEHGSVITKDARVADAGVIETLW